MAHINISLNHLRTCKEKKSCEFIFYILSEDLYNSKLYCLTYRSCKDDITAAPKLYYTIPGNNRVA